MAHESKFKEQHPEELLLQETKLSRQVLVKCQASLASLLGLRYRQTFQSRIRLEQVKDKITDTATQNLDFRVKFHKPTLFAITKVTARNKETVQAQQPGLS